jgi:hypothetical protein
MSKKDDGRVDTERLLEVVQEFCMSRSFEAEFEAFAKEHTDVFMQSLEFAENAEHPLAFHDVYRQYLTKFEAMIEEYIVQVCHRKLSYSFSIHSS